MYKILRRIPVYTAMIDFILLSTTENPLVEIVLKYRSTARQIRALSKKYIKFQTKEIPSRSAYIE